LTDARLNRRRFIGTSMGAAAALYIAACGGGSGDSSGGTQSAGEFPATVKHMYGATTIEKAPSRVVSYGYTDQDPILALGTVPVGILQWIPQWKRGVGEWSEPALGSARPKLFNTPEVDFEGIAATRPDLIVAVNYDLKKGDYEKLSKLAPTVPAVPGYPPYGLPWDVGTRQVGAALGRRSQAESLITRAKERFAAARKDNPAFAGKTAMIVTPNTGGKISIFADTDTRGRFVAQLGLKQPDGVAAVTKGAFYADLSPERFDLLNVDALIMLADETAARASLDKLPTYQRLDVVKDGRVVVVEDLSLSMALSASSVTSIPYALDRLVPELQRVLA
jgi:iron complex transport system substrate-binding protein